MSPEQQRQHTPGPWNNNTQPDVIEDGHDRTIAEANLGEPNYRANANLIAAAPDLLAACKAAYGVLVGTCFRSLLEEVDAREKAAHQLWDAIRKAEGEAGHGEESQTGR